MIETFELSKKSQETIKTTLNVESLDDVIDIDYKDDSDTYKNKKRRSRNRRN